MKADLLAGLISFRGRLARAAFWWRMLALWAVFVLLFIALEQTLGGAATFILYPPFLWVGLALCTRRLRDRGYAPGWLAAALVPVAGPLWLAIELGLRRGTRGENAYGPDPLPQQQTA